MVCMLNDVASAEQTSAQPANTGLIAAVSNKIICSLPFSA